MTFSKITNNVANNDSKNNSTDGKDNCDNNGEKISIKKSVMDSK